MTTIGIVGIIIIVVFLFLFFYYVPFMLWINAKVVGVSISLLQLFLMRIRKVLHQLPEPYKEVFLWRVFAELSFKEIGQMFGKTHNWACVTYHRAKAMVRQRLEENET